MGRSDSEIVVPKADGLGARVAAQACRRVGRPLAPPFPERADGAGAALKAIDRTRGIEKFIIVPMNGQTQQEAFDKKTAKEIVKNMKPGGGTKSLKTLIPKGLDYEYDTYAKKVFQHGRN